ncbi:uncharacterized protein LOC143195422 [Rhynchophorus ferrugineus]|uniref:PID domain-containing protein n=1 Tax=Rhynchophorus ferrugineus TaxID=354439 RepID=A0A834IKC4_RHYFE|nr:hypothetical protein GWI33_006974 [Rhynchophorus ferrugineus]
MNDKEPTLPVPNLPVSFVVKYLGHHAANGLWGIKHTRKPVDILVAEAKALPAGVILPSVEIVISQDGFSFTELHGKKDRGDTHTFTVEVISYGVQDLVYTRVFSMIIVADESLKSATPFVCHSFVCDSRDQARQITYALAATFQNYGRKVQKHISDSGKPMKRLAIDLRTPEELAEDNDGETEV